ncbi:unnamed protein product [Triticum turgidum subsp. durum]|uniref:Uncharacterized protein n=1 Tax=Triticum turgidum subsp. durum TaxID=4567 RepID=A0A9R0RCS8_TRITD|nr:unnamed protein product [Triticum turgidum subsp. durum]
MAAHKRLHDGFEQDPDQPEKKRMERSVSFSTVIREAMVMKQVQSVFLVLEPLLRRVVQEEIQAGLLVPLFGDFPPDGREDWTTGEFARGVVKERAGKRPLLTGDVGLTMRDGRAVVNDLQFTDNSSWVRCRKFRIGARVMPGSYEGGRVAEAMTDAFNVRDHRGELYRKHYPPALTDDVWRLEKIGKEGAFHRKLRQNGVETVQEFVRMLTVRPEILRAIMGDGMTDRMWEVTTSHAKTCDAGDKVYAYAGHGATVYVNSLCQLVRLEFAGVECAAQQLSRDQKAYVHRLYVEAFEQRHSLQEAEPLPAAMLLHASSSSNSLPMLQNAAPVAPPPLPATPLWFQGNQELDLQIVDELSGGQGNFGFQMFQSNFS